MGTEEEEGGTGELCKGDDIGVDVEEGVLVAGLRLNVNFDLGAL